VEDVRMVEESKREENLWGLEEVWGGKGRVGS
jgi:hypothetical protein